MQAINESGAPVEAVSEDDEQAQKVVPASFSSIEGAKSSLHVDSHQPNLVDGDGRQNLSGRSPIQTT
jgi:hypothetical protein